MKMAELYNRSSILPNTNSHSQNRSFIRHKPPDTLFKAIRDSAAACAKETRLKKCASMKKISEKHVMSDTNDKVQLNEIDVTGKNVKDEPASRRVNVQPLTYQKCEKGTLLLGCVEEILDVQLWVSLVNGLHGTVSALNVSDAYTKMVKDSLRDMQTTVTPLHDLYSRGDLVRCEVIQSPDTHGPVKLSINPRSVNRNILCSNVVQGLGIQGSVASKQDHGYVIDLGVDGLTGFLPHDDALQYLRGAVKVGATVVCRVEQKTDQVATVTTNPRLINRVEKHTKSMFSVQPGSWLKATVSKVGRGVIAEFLGQRVTVHMDHMSAPPVTCTPGSQITARVVYVNYTTKKVGLTQLPHLNPLSRVDLSKILTVHVDSVVTGLRVGSWDRERLHLTTKAGVKAFCLLSDFPKDRDLETIKTDLASNTTTRGKVKGVNYIDNVAYIDLIFKTKQSRAEDRQVQRVSRTVKDTTHSIATGGTVSRERKRNIVEQPLERLQLSCGFSWDETFRLPDGDNAQESDSNEDDETLQPKIKKSKSSIKKQQLEEEKHLYEAERELAGGSQAPQTADAFDRLVLQSPNSSLVWLRYMAFHLESGDVGAARSTAERALKTIIYREEQEKLNVWLAYLNLENMYGTPESVNELLHRAIRYNDPWKVYLQLLNIYTQSEKIEEGEQLLLTMMKKFKQDKRAWIEFASFYYKNGRAESARTLLQRALKSLDKHLHVEVISKISQLECQHGQIEIGKSMFEQLLATYPKRTDLWSVYIDIIVKAGQNKEARQIFERITRMRVPAKKMKFFFKKYLDFETHHGTADSVEGVKQRALEYVESKQS